MGLDSIELVMEFEKYFAIEIPDQDAEKLWTIGRTIDYIAQKLNVTETNCAIKLTTLKNIIDNLKRVRNYSLDISLESSLQSIFGEIKRADLDLVINSINYQVPDINLFDKDSGKIIDKVKNWISWKPNCDVPNLTLSEIIIKTIANNLELLVDPKNVKTIDEIEAAVIRIVVDKIGVDYFEVTRTASYTNDLGVD